ncbi:hypothetical protein [Dawidia soli]|uniref:Uncharacterized protein n=1 Tax=Dawidia soli TaxID=2782352 RepID=A0AAP2DD03_9BACT|nr:hypothetical protein [Dawidia soli]MBT1688886.1 hypothetical protein [Dawidia soli]
MRIGTVTFQANDSRDVFYVADVYDADTPHSDESLIRIEDSHFSAAPYVTGEVPKFAAVDIEGDNALITAWFKGEIFSGPLVVRIYVQYEETEELLEVEVEETDNDGRADPLDPIEIHL